MSGIIKFVLVKIFLIAVPSAVVMFSAVRCGKDVSFELNGNITPSIESKTDAAD